MKAKHWTALALFLDPWLSAGVHEYWGQWPAFVMGGYAFGLGITAFVRTMMEAGA